MAKQDVGGYVLGLFHPMLWRAWLTTDTTMRQASCLAYLVPADCSCHRAMQLA
jgi:hypothetical protein